ncbi:hypothetical protein T4A_100 [Trichinella pseudospiralis]|uniref:Uncharacterized protein n=3 Tax=Trichinella pseudospiralis TaxID=6337 RepID=A0A0V1EJN1_TRIPS|nr:hypothetical protein T4A_100 [Trichinella pseudospiralis]
MKQDTELTTTHSEENQSFPYNRPNLLLSCAYSLNHTFQKKELPHASEQTQPKRSIQASRQAATACACCLFVWTILISYFAQVPMEFNQPDLSILHEDSDTVEVALRFSGLKLPTLMDKLVNFFKDRPMPDRLFRNAKFSLWNLKSDQLELELTVRGDDKKETNYRYVIRRFPCEIDVHRARLKAKQSYDKTHSFLIIEFYKSRHGADWKTFMALHGNLDAG